MKYVVVLATIAWNRSFQIYCVGDLEEAVSVDKEIFRTLGGGTGELGNQIIDQEPGLQPLHIRDTS